MKIAVAAAYGLLLSASIYGCNSSNTSSGGDQQVTDSTDVVHEYGEAIVPQEPFATEPTNKFATIVGWKDGETPKAPAGYKVVKFADGLNSPRNIYVAKNGDIFVAQSRTEEDGQSDEYVKARNIFRSPSPDEILVFKDNNGDGTADDKKVFLSGLKQPYGMLILGDHFYVGNTDALMRYPYSSQKGTLSSQKGEKLVTLPAGGYNNHWTRNLITNKAGNKIFISVGSGSDVGENGMEHEVRRAVILEVNPDGSGERTYGSGLRNAVGMDMEPQTNMLWTAVNERDELGDELVPDYITSVQAEKFYGWPYYYWGMHIEPRWKDRMPKNLPESQTPDYAVGAHTASLGFAFNKAPGFETGAFIGQHGSWNRSEFVGYKVAFVPFANGEPNGPVQDFLTGFIANKDKKEVRGRPCGIAFTKNYMLVADDAANVIWAIIPEKTN
ncbi:PQQ-dependent sugar dehydrogenase [Sphingobacterium sp. lm-10]|uniref:PQQ-dependent sugar dehydrogenase n=1 Tax=Sphingobacterium sp. lm-10 TaxID=2944904 RepID=UPI0020208043|nr:PQQ-dependent sugar dehydrogenase [Sphingobacterium sp. lm-10]MCL7988172.1 PQQ-dependent sugar dehydrogenase [Sphingobacterium sp. lm-10]